MGAQKMNSELVSFFEENLLIHADSLYRIALVELLNEEQAWKEVFNSFQAVVDELELNKSKDSDACLLLLIEKLWVSIESNSASSHPTSDVLKSIQKIPKNGRMAVVLIDVLGLSTHESAVALKVTEAELEDYIAEGRQYLTV